MRNQRLSPRRLLGKAGGLLALMTGLAVVYSCSLIVENRSQQCQSDDDCKGFAGFTTCDKTSGVCTGPGSPEGGSPVGCNVDGGIDGGGCYNGGSGTCPAASDNSELLNACTTGCIPFDNTRVTLLKGGKLPDLPSPGPDAGM